MGYFSNGTEVELYFERYCDRCVNLKDRGMMCKTCPIIDMHFEWNDDVVQGDETKRAALDALIPMSADGLYCEQCTMFHEAGGR